MYYYYDYVPDDEENKAIAILNSIDTPPSKEYIRKRYGFILDKIETDHVEALLSETTPPSKEEIQQKYGFILDGLGE
jgi:hypothetical protein